MPIPRVSVVVPMYRAEAYISRTIESVLAQTFTDFELLLVDDGCTDGTVAAAQRHDDARIRLLRQPNRGVCEARNHGIREAQGAYIALLDSDDLWAADKLAKHVAHLDANPTVGVSYSWSAFIDEHGAPVGGLQQPKLSDVQPIDIWCRCPISNGSCPVIRRAVFDQIRFDSVVDGHTVDAYFDARDAVHMSEDCECWYRMAIQSPLRMEGIGEPLTLYRIYDSSTSANMAAKRAAWARTLEWVDTYDPGFMRDHGDAAMAYHDRYLARRAISLGKGGTAVRMAGKALARYPKILLQEPKKTAVTVAAALATSLLPRAVMQRLLGLAS